MSLFAPLIYIGRKIIVALIFCVCVCSDTQAQGELLDLDLEQLMQIPITGSTLKEESIKTVPAAVTVFSHEDIQRLGMDYLYELINLVPGYQFDRHGDTAAGYTFSARGRRNGAQAREVLLLVDGRVFSNARNGGADTSLPLFPLALIERVEVIRGPGSALHGSSAFVGVINVITRNNANSLNVDLGSQDRAEINALMSKESGDWAANLFLHSYSDDGDSYRIKDTFTQELISTNDPHKAINLDGGVRWQDTQLRFSYHRTKSSDFYSLENTQNGYSASVSTLKQMSIEHDYAWSDVIKTKFYVGYLYSGQDLDAALMGENALIGISTPASSAPLLVKGRIAGTKLRTRITTQWAMNNNDNLLLGIESLNERETLARSYHNYDLEQLANSDFPINYYGNFSHYTTIGSLDTYRSVGLYGQYLRDITNTTYLTLGARIDRYGDLSDHASPRLGMVHEFNETNTFKLLYGESYRAPSLSETGLINNPAIIGNPDLTYEVANTWDLIWMLHWRSIQSSLGAFRTDYENPIVAGFEGSVRTLINGEDEFSEGIEWELQQQLSELWSLRVTYTHFLHLPDSAFREAEHLASMQLNYEQGAWNWNIASFFQDERKTLGVGNQQHTLEDFVLVNSKLRYRFEEGFDINLQVKNLTNTNYVTPTQGARIAEGIVGRGREVSIGWEWSF